MPAVDEQALELGGFRTRALVVAMGGKGRGGPFVLLHGWSDSADTWRPLLRRLGEDGRRAIALDMPGFGRAERLDREREILPQLDAFVAAAIERESVRAAAPSSSSATRSAAAPRCARPRIRGCRSPGSCRSLPPGSTWRAGSGSSRARRSCA